MAYTWGSTELKVLKDGYKPFSSSETVINEIEIIPGSTNTGDIVSSLQVGPRRRRKAKLECFTSSLADCRVLEADRDSAVIRTFSDGAETQDCIILSIDISNNSHSKIWFYTLELLEVK